MVSQHTSPSVSTENSKALESIQFLALTGPASKPFSPVISSTNSNLIVDEEAIAQDLDLSDDSVPNFSAHHTRANSQASEVSIE